VLKSLTGLAMYSRVRDYITEAIKQLDTIKDVRFNDKLRVATITTTEAVVKISYELVTMLGEIDTYKYLFSSIVYSEHHHLRARNV